MSEKAIVILKEQIRDIEMDIAKARSTMESFQMCKETLERIVFKLEDEDGYQL